LKLLWITAQHNSLAQGFRAIASAGRFTVSIACASRAQEREDNRTHGVKMKGDKFDKV
jgi:hypothetical protein